VEEYNNKVQIVALDEDASEFTAKSTFDHPYPTTKIMWIPDSKAIFPDLLATSGDYSGFGELVNLKQDLSVF
jgi:WD repeat-containing protein 68